MNRLLSTLKYIVFFSLAVILAGCGGSTTASAPTPPSNPTPAGPMINTGAAVRIYVVQSSSTDGESAGTSPDSILEFAATASGAVSPASMINPGTPVQQIGTDEFGDIFYADGNIFEYASGATGTPTATREIMNGTTSRICCIDGLAIGRDGTVVLGQDSGEVDVWNNKATGDVAPDRFILGNSQTGGGMSPVQVANQVAVDASGTVYVGAANNPGTAGVVVFGPDATGNVVPTRTIGPDKLVGGVAVDSAGSVYTTTDTCTFTGMTLSCTGTISVYAATATATDPPTRVISGSATELASLWGLKVDAVGNIYVISTDGMGLHPSVLKFSPTATGNEAPASSFTSTEWTNPGFNPSIAIY